MNNPNPFFLAILGMVLLSACSGGSTPQPSASATPEVVAPTLPEPTLEAALPTMSSTSDPTAAQPAATLPPVFDLTRTKDNPITDAQQIIEILEALESIQRAQPVPPGWYLRSSIDLEDPENPEHSYNLYHIIGDDVNCDLVMQFMLSPDENILWWMAQNEGMPIYRLPGGEMALNTDAMDDNICDQSNSPYSFFSEYSNTFSNSVNSSMEFGQDGDYSFSAWFEDEEGELLFILQENTDNIQSGYATDPDTNESVLVRSEESIKTYSIGTGLIVEYQSIMNLANNNFIRHTATNQREYFQEMTELPPSVLAYLEESLRKYDELQVP